MSARVLSGVRPGAALPVLAAAAAAVAALWPSAASLASNWLTIHDYRHGFIIAPVALLWLAVAARHIPLQQARASLTGSVLLAAALLVWLVAFRAHSDIAIEAWLPPVIWLAILASCGWHVARAVIAPVAYLYFAIPVWEFLVPTLQWLSVHVTETALAIAGVPAEVTEYLVTLPSGSFEIVEGCSGKRYFVVALAVSVIAGVFQQLRGWRMLALLLASGLLALAANWLRIFVVIYAGYATEMQHYLVAVEHETFGNVIFAVLLAAIYVASRLVARGGRRRLPGTKPRVEPVAGVLPELQAALLVPFALLAGAAALAHVPMTAPALTGDFGHLPVAAGQWQGPMPPAVAWSPRFARPDGERRASYRTATGRTVEVYLNFYASQGQGRELVYYDNSLLAPGFWSRSWPREMRVLEADGVQPLATMEALGPFGQRWLLAYVYKIGGWTTFREPLAQAGYGLRSLLRPAPAGVVSLTVQCGENCQEAQVLVRDFWQEMSGSLLGMIPDDAA
jgi:EpsI family protein